jgi:hypothetical protein
MRHLAVPALVLVLLVSTVSAPLAGVAAASGPPSGFVGVPAENVGPPDHANAPSDAGPPPGAGPPADLGPPGDLPTEAAAWDVLATDHAGTLSVEVGTTADGRLALRLGDLENHAGREVAVSASTLEDALGYRPETVTGLHSSGERWTASVRYDGSHAVFSVPRFSTNTITFDAEKSVVATPAEDGDTFTYDVADSDAVENLSVTLTGRENVQDAGTQTIASDGDSVAVSVGGTTDPRNATVEFTGRRALLDGTQVESRNDHTGTGQTLEVESGVVYSAATDGVVAYDTATDSVLWSAAPTSGNVTAVDADGGRVILGGSQGEVYVLDASSGTVQNSHTSEHSGAVTAVAVDDGADMAYSGDGAGGSGFVSTWDLSQDATGGATFDYEVTALAADGDGYVVGLADGTVDSSGPYGYWTDASHHVSTRDLELGDGVLYSVGKDSVKAANASDGTVLWSHSEHTADGLAVSASTDGETVYSSAEDGRVVAYDPSSGAVAWEHSAHTTEAASIAYDAPNGTLYSLGVDDSTVLGYQDRRPTEDPAVDLDGDGTAEASVSGVLEDGQTHTETIPLSTSTSSLDVSTTASTEVGLNVTWEEVTETQNPEVTVNGHTVGYDGTLAAGATTDLNVSDAWVENGTNNVSVAVSTVADGPPGLVGLDYSHRALEERGVVYSATVWSETYDVSRTYVSDVDDATLRVPWASDRVVAVRSVTATVNGTEVSPTYASENGTLEVSVGQVSEGATVNVTATGSKVQVQNGAIRVVNATESGLSLDSRVEVTSVTDAGNFSLEVGGTDEGHLLHHSSDETWSETSSYLTVSPDGSQTLHLEGAAEGGRFSVATTAVEVRPTGADVEAIVLDPAEPRFRLREAAGSPEADEVEILYYDTTSGQEYELYSETSEHGVATDVAESPVEFLVDGGDETYSIRLYDSPSATGDGAAVAVGAEGSSSGLAPAAVVLGAGVAIVGAVLVGRRFGVDGTRGTLLLGAVALVVAAIGAEAVTRGSVVALVVEAFLDPLVDSQIGVVAGAIGLLLGVWAVNDWVGLPWWVVGLAVAGDAIWLLDTVTGGALGGGLGEVSALLWLVGIFGGMYLVYTRLKPRDIVIDG